MLGEILTLMGLIDREHLEKALFIQKSTGMKIGSILVEQGTITPQDLQRGLKNVIVEEVYDILFWNHASFNFVEQSSNPVFEDPELKHLETTINMNEFLQDITKKISEIDVLKQWVPNEAAVFIIKENVKKENRRII